MGWFWQTPPTSPKSQPVAAPAATPAAADGVDPEIAKFLAAFQEDVKTEKKPAASSPPSSKPTDAPTKPASSSNSSWFSFLSAPAASTTPSTSDTSAPVYPVREPSTQQNPLTRAAPRSEQQQQQPPPPWAPHSSPGAAELSHSLLPTTMSCRQAFDLAFGCQSPAGQWNAVFRHGEARSCNEFWGDFWFCMRTRTWPTEAREEAIREHYRAKEERKYYAPGQPSSEDVWRSRDRKVEPGTAFPMDFSRSAADAKGDEDARHNLLEIERRRRIRKDLGFDESTS